MTCVAKRLQGVRLSARPVQSKHALGVQILAQGLLLDQRLQFGDHLAMAPGGEVAVDRELECVEPPLLQSADLGGREWLRDIGQRSPLQSASASPRSAGGQQPLEAQRIALVF